LSTWEPLHDARSEAHNVEAARYDWPAPAPGDSCGGGCDIFALVCARRVGAPSSRRPVFLDQAVDLKVGGLVAGLDVLRAELELNMETRRASAATTDFEKAKLQLARLIGRRSASVFPRSESA
jgi:hypothetical protein